DNARPVETIICLIKETVRLRIMSLSLNDSTQVSEAASLWNFHRIRDVGLLILCMVWMTYFGLGLNLGTSDVDLSGLQTLVKKLVWIKANSLASKIGNINGKILPRRYTTYQEPLKDDGSSKSNISNVKDKVDTIRKIYFASVVHEKPQKMIIKIKEMRNKVSVNGAAVTIPIEAVESVNARFVNTLYGCFIGDRLAFLLVEKYVKNTWAKYGLKRIQLHEEFFLFQFNTKEGMESIGKPLMLDSYTSNMCLNSWGRNAYARVLIEIVADVELVKSLIIAISMGNKEGHTFATIDIEYEWTPPRCASCCIFDHVSEKCPKLPKVASNEKVIKEGFIEVKKKKTKTKKKSDKQVEGVRLNKPTLNLQYRQCVNADDQTPVKSQFVNDSDEDVDEYITMEEISKAIIADRKEFFCSFVYAFNKYIYRRPLWNGLCLHKNYINNRPWCLLGDFNAPLFVEDTSMGSSSLDVTMREFKECVKNMEVMDVQRTGLQYTWNQKPKGKDGILRKLDWVLANLEFLDDFLGAHAIFKPYRILDHLPAVLSIPSLVKVKPMPFRIFNVIILDDRFKDVVQNVWMAQISSFYMFRVVKNLKGLKKPIRKLMYDKGNLHANVIRLQEELDKVQTDLDSDPNNLSHQEKEAVTVVDFNEALLMEEKFLTQMAKITWLKEGDSNTTYFHKVVKSHVSRSRIDVVTDAYGNVHHSTKVAKAFINHYEIFLRQKGNTSNFNTDNLFPTTLNESEALNMVRDISSQEVKLAMFSMGNDKSPGPNGFTAAFFKDTWDIIGVDVIKAVKEFFTIGRLLKELNHTIIALIPKVNTPTCVTDYRPISCCNVLFMCISNIIANRLKGSLKRLVSPNQSAFVPGRCISDNILLTQKIMHNYHLDHGVPRCAFKVDIQKAYDTVDWDFLRGLRQGDSLSPYLFTLVMEVFTLMLKRRVSETSTFTYHRFCLDLDLINLCFADDLFLFAHGDVNSEKFIKDALDDFKDASGLNPSMPKSKAYFCNVINYTKLAILNILPFEEDRLPVKYLGIHLVSSQLISKDYNTSRGKVKVAWDVVCLPKQEGGLGIRRLDHFNKALMVSHVWKLLSLKESLLVKWIHVYKLKNRSFWDIPYRERLLCGLISGVLRVLYPTSFHHVTLLELVLTMLPRDGMGKPFSVHNVWDSIRPRDNPVPLCDLVWFHACILRHTFNMWLISKQRLRTQDCLRSWEVNSDLAVVCPLCAGPSPASIITHLLSIA
nr:hypothetical protein [Tanacetum cinerariifolium]